MTTVQDYLSYPGNSNINPYMLQYTSPSEDIYVSNKVSQDLINNYNKVMSEEKDYNKLIENMTPLQILEREIKTPVSRNPKSTSSSTPKATNEVIKPDENEEQAVVQTSSSTESSPKWVSIYKNNKDKWIADMTAAYKKHNLSDQAIKNLIAKNALESAWGSSAQGDFNFGNIITNSRWTGRYVQGGDKDGNGNAITQKFRAYNSLEEFVADELDLLKRAYEFNDQDDFDTFIRKLQGGNKDKRRYAASKNYEKVVRDVYNSLA